MKRITVVIASLLAVLLCATVVVAGDFEWLKELNIKAVNDPAGFRAQLATRFKIGNAEVQTVIGNVKQPADAYMVLRLGEMSGQPVKVVQDRYYGEQEQGQGWGQLAKSLGIKPGSKEFHALKRGHDLQGFGGDEGGGGKGKGKGKGWKNK